MNEFYGTMKTTPKYGKCDPIFVKGHWVKKDIGKSGLMHYKAMGTILKEGYVPAEMVY